MSIEPTGRHRRICACRSLRGSPTTMRTWSKSMPADPNRADRSSAEPESLAAEHERPGPEEPEQGESECLTVVREEQRATGERGEQAQQGGHQHRYLDLSVAHGTDDVTAARRVGTSSA
jgi:hypothetical protein